MLSLLADHNFNANLIRGLLRRAPDADLVVARDCGLAEAEDPALLAWAAQHDRVVLFHDRRTLAGFVTARIAQGLPMAGLVVVKNALPKDILDDLVLICAATEQHEWRNKIDYVPYPRGAVGW